MVKVSGADRALIASQSSRSVSTKGFDHGELEALAVRCDAATGPDLVLNADIFRECGKPSEEHVKMWCRMDGRTDLTRERYIEAWAPDYTKSIDAAMTLVPEGLMVEMGIYNGADGFGGTGNFARVSDYCGGDGPRFECEDRSEGASLALALCAAALRARAAT